MAPVDTPPKRHVLGPGHEPRFIRVMPEQAGELPEGVGLLHLGVPEDHVEALYGPLNHAATTCAEAPLCVTLRHPSAALAGDRLVGPFALRVEGLGEVDAAALLGGITTRLQAEGDLDPWVESRPKTPSAPDESESAPADAPVDAPLWWPVAALCGLALFVGVLWRRRRRDP